MMQRLPICLAVALCLVGHAGAADAPGQGKIDNSALIPKIVLDAEVRLEGASPDWVKTLIMAELRIETATPEGTFAGARRVLDHYAEMGVNGLWIDPVQARGPAGNNGYLNLGPDTMEPSLASPAADVLGETRRFVDEAHRRNIRLFFDIVTWGTRADSPLVTKHPEFYARENGGFRKVWGGYAFDWNRADLKAWYKRAAVDFIINTGADGFRVDLAPDTSGYFFKEVRDALSARGRKIALVSELPSARRDVFDFEQVGVTGWTEEPAWAGPEKLQEQKQKFGLHNAFLLQNNLVDIVRSGRGIGQATLQQQGRGGAFRFYTSNLLNHDDTQPFAQADRVRFAYTGVFAPFIPMWWIGEEWNNPKKRLIGPGTGQVMYFNLIDWQAKERPENAAFFEDVKRYLRIRRSYPEIFQNFPENHRLANVVKVEAKQSGAGGGDWHAYARFAGKRAVLVVPNNGAVPGGNFEVEPPYDALGAGSGAACQVTDLMTGQVIAHGRRAEVKSFPAQIAAHGLGVYLLEALP